MRFLASIIMFGALAFPATAAAQRPTLKYGSTGDAVRSLQKRLGIESDGVFGKQTLGRVLGVQTGNGLRPDGVVGPKTWRHVIRPHLPSEGMSFTGTGNRRAVLDKRNNVLFLINGSGRVVRRLWTVDNDVFTPAGPTTTQGRVRTSLNIEESGAIGDLRLHFFVWINRARGIGFHAIPRRPDGTQIHSTSALGAGTTYASHGCVRLSYSGARFVYGWLPDGSSVNVVTSL